MKNKFNRRDFLKLAGLLPPAYYLKPDKFLTAQDAATQDAATQDAAQPNFIILVFDAWSANNISLYGYPRQTTPFMEKLAEKAIVFHNHYSAGMWTYTGTTGLLTGVLPWTHRGYTEARPYLEEYGQKNIFGLFDNHHRLAYTHNPIADSVLKRMIQVIDEHKPRQELYVNDNYWLATLFDRDYDIASTSWIRAANKFDDGYANSLFLSRLNSIINTYNENRISNKYPLGLPAVEGNNYFYLETAIDWIEETAKTLSTPFLSYYHLLPPHAPYLTRKDFYEKFKGDGYTPVHKPDHIFTQDISYEFYTEKRRIYDEFILWIDSEINRLYQNLQDANALDNTWVIITSDHGELFERGMIGHKYASYYNPMAHVPLMILPPGQQERIDIHTPTSALDLIPTLLHLSGKDIPDWLEGKLLPPFQTAPTPDRPIFGMDARYSEQEGPFTTATVMLRQNQYKLTYLFGDQKKYEALNGEEMYELFDLENDPEELDNLYAKEPEIAQKLKDLMFEEMRKHGAR